MTKKLCWFFSNYG